MKIAAIVAAILIAVFLLVPSSMAACGATINVQPGDPVTLTMTPLGSYDYLWTTPGIPSTGTLSTITFEAPVIKTPGSDGCQVFTVTGQLTSNVDGKVYSTCTDQCNVYLHVCPRECPPRDDKGKMCINQYPTAGWAISVPGNYQEDDTFTWTVKETTLGGAKDVTLIDTGVKSESHTFVVTDFEAPTNAMPERCYQISLVVTSNNGQILLTCQDVGDICLIYKPTISIN